MVTGLVYLVNGKTIGSYDTKINGLLTISMIEEKNFDLNEFAPMLVKDTGEGLPYFLTQLKGRYLSVFPPGPSLFALPVFLVAGWLGYNPLLNLQSLEKLSATVAVALSAVFVFLSLSLLTNERWAYIITFIYAFCSASWSLSSQALWQHGPSQLFLSASIFCLLMGEKRPWLHGVAGAALAFSLLCRSFNGIAISLLGLFVLLHRRKGFPFFMASFIPLAALLLLYNYSFYGHPLGGCYHFGVTSASYWKAPYLKTLLAIILSPSRGLLIYCPIFIFSFVGLYLAMKEARRKPLCFFITLVPVFNLLVLAKFTPWWGGWCYGPRYLADSLPFLSLMLVPVVERPPWKRIFKLSLLLLIPYSLFLQLLGVFSLRPHLWNAMIYMGGDLDSEALLSWRLNPILYSITAPFDQGLPKDYGLPSTHWRAETNFMQKEAALAFDRNPQSRWNSRVKQKRGEVFFVLDLSREEKIGKAVLYTGPFPQEYPRGLLIEASGDGEHWQKVGSFKKILTLKNALTIPFSEPVVVRYLRFTLMGDNNLFHWAIGEVFLYPA